MSFQNFKVIHLEMSKLWPFTLCVEFPQARMVATMLEDISPFYRTIYRKISKQIKDYFSKTFFLNEIKFGRVIKNAIFYEILKVWTCSS